MIEFEDNERNRLYVENIKMRHALKSFVDAHERALRGADNNVEFTKEEVERIKRVQELL